ncbi:MAG: ketopantoate reductase family protein [Eubacteriales bacterium]|nr:ketopantoate reductase family protein [Eubacteriales bacterium]
MKIAILGSGAMGSIYGGLLSQNEEVWCIDVWKDHVDKINKEGLVLEENGEKTVYYPKAVSAGKDIGVADLVIIFVKSINTAEALKENMELFGEDTVALSLQNGYGNAEDIIEHIKEENMLLGTTSHGGTVIGPGHILHAGRGKTHIGAYKPSEKNALMVETVVDAMNKAGFDAYAADDVLSMIWKKLMANILMNGITAILDVKNGFVAENENMRTFCRDIMREGWEVAKAEGFELDYDALVDEFIMKGPAAMKQNYSSMLQDTLKKRKTEVERINGAVSKLGKKYGIATPINDVVLRLINLIEEAYDSKMSVRKYLQ